jgi:hypothetical protein
VPSTIWFEATSNYTYIVPYPREMSVPIIRSTRPSRRSVWTSAHRSHAG